MVTLSHEEAYALRRLLYAVHIRELGLDLFDTERMERLRAMLPAEPEPRRELDPLEVLREAVSGNIDFRYLSVSRSDVNEALRRLGERK